MKCRFIKNVIQMYTKCKSKEMEISIKCKSNELQMYMKCK